MGTRAEVLLAPKGNEWTPDMGLDGVAEFFFVFLGASVHYIEIVLEKKLGGAFISVGINE